MDKLKQPRIFDKLGKIVFVNVLSDTVYHIGIECPDIAGLSMPGQFVMIKVDCGYDPLLRRPFSIYRAENGIVEIVYKVVGKGTHFLSAKNEGSEIGVLGPLGNSFNTDDKYDSYVLVNGGIGFPPLSFFTEILHRQKKEIIFYYGAVSVNDLFCKNEIEKRCSRLIEVTEDGSSGRKGLVTDIFSEDVRNGLIKNNTAVISCGPLPMLKEMCSLSARYNFHLNVSLENVMACGIGICQGCAVKVTGDEGFRYKLVCKDGPVFNAGEILWDA